jgi:hypothetical protein
MRVIIMGPQGAGKGTQAAKLEEELGATHIETGDLGRSEIKSETELGQKIKKYSDKGELVPDEIIIEMTKPYLEKNDSWILDGFPRNKEQAQALDEALNEIGEKVDNGYSARSVGRGTCGAAFRAAPERSNWRGLPCRAQPATGGGQRRGPRPVRPTRGRHRRGYPDPAGELLRADRAAEELLRGAGYPRHCGRLAGHGRGDRRRAPERKGKRLAACSFGGDSFQPVW